jgi:GDP-4-dehydro-6-deoxy-D-mannose reductase
MKKTLITGITGFTGSHLAELLVAEKGSEIYGTYTSDKKLAHIEGIKDSIHLLKVNLLDAPKVRDIVADIKPDVIYHLAAISSVASSFDEPSQTLVNNAAAQINLQEAIQHAHIPMAKIIIISSAYVYGLVQESDLPINEQVPFRPNNAYAVSKITQDYIGMQYFLSYKQQVIRLRPFNHIGPRLSPEISVSRFAKQIVAIERGQHEPILSVGNLDAKRDFTDVRDIARAYVLAESHCEAGEAYNIGSGTSYRIGDILNELLAMSSVKITVREEQSLLRASDIPELLCDATKFISRTHWKPEITLDQSLRDTLDYWRNID